MKKTIFLFAVVLALYACNRQTDGKASIAVNEEYEYFGDTLDVQGALPVENIVDLLTKQDSAFTKVTGTIHTVCQKKGCWMTIALNEDENLFIKFRDYEFFVPLNCEGRTAVIEGWAFKEEVSVDELRHYAFDEGKTEEEINAINAPEITYSFMANGVVLL
jgi:hypothetical protein